MRKSKRLTMKKINYNSLINFNISRRRSLLMNCIINKSNYNKLSIKIVKYHCKLRGKNKQWYSYKKNRKIWHKIFSNYNKVFIICHNQAKKTCRKLKN